MKPTRMIALTNSEVNTLVLENLRLWEASKDPQYYRRAMFLQDLIAPSLKPSESPESETFQKP